MSNIVQLSGSVSPDLVYLASYEYLVRLLTRTLLSISPSTESTTNAIHRRARTPRRLDSALRAARSQAHAGNRFARSHLRAAWNEYLFSLWLSHVRIDRIVLHSSVDVWCFAKDRTSNLLHDQMRRSIA